MADRFLHVLPNVLAPVLVLMSVVIGGAILVEASASFLGFGIAPPNSSLGSMLSANVSGSMTRAALDGARARHRDLPDRAVIQSRR